MSLSWGLKHTTAGADGPDMLRIPSSIVLGPRARSASQTADGSLYNPRPRTRGSHEVAISPNAFAQARAAQDSGSTGEALNDRANAA